jgi:hypothetical protein
LAAQVVLDSDHVPLLQVAVAEPLVPAVALVSVNECPEFIDGTLDWQIFVGPQVKLAELHPVDIHPVDRYKLHGEQPNLLQPRT